MMRSVRRYTCITCVELKSTDNAQNHVPNTPNPIEPTYIIVHTFAELRSCLLRIPVQLVQTGGTPADNDDDFLTVSKSRRSDMPRKCWLLLNVRTFYKY